MAYSQITNIIIFNVLVLEDRELSHNYYWQWYYKFNEVMLILKDIILILLLVILYNYEVVLIL